jgi:hypothetical protein
MQTRQKWTCARRARSYHRRWKSKNQLSTFSNRPVFIARLQIALIQTYHEASTSLSSAAQTTPRTEASEGLIAQVQSLYVALELTWCWLSQDAMNCPNEQKRL